MLSLIDAVEVVPLQEGVHRRRVVVVLVLGRLVRLGLDQQHPVEADLRLVLDDEAHEAPELVRLAPQVGVEQRVVALAPAPEDVVGAAEAMGHLQAVLHLRGRVGEDLRVGVGGRAGRVARVAEQVGGAPEQADSGGLHPSRHPLGDARDVVVALREGGALGRDVAVVKAEERHSQLLEELERGVQLALAGLEAVGPGQPRMRSSVAAPNMSTPGCVERVPVADGRPQVVLHPLAEHLAVPVVVAERERVGGFRTLVIDAVDVVEERCAHDSAPLPNSSRRAAYRAR